MYVERKVMLVISQPVKGKTDYFILFAIARVSSPPVLVKAAIDREPWFTGTIEHRFSNSVDQSERA